MKEILRRLDNAITRVFGEPRGGMTREEFIEHVKTSGATYVEVMPFRKADSYDLPNPGGVPGLGVGSESSLRHSFSP